jgi:hypothetical protein
MKRYKKLFFCLLITGFFYHSSAFAQRGVVFRAGYSYSPEDGLLIFPPIHLSLEYQLARESNTCYFGLCTGGGIIIAPWGGVGAYWGYKLNSLFIENKINCFFLGNTEPKEGQSSFSKQLSINPKIGFEAKHFYVKVGPYIPINPKQDNSMQIIKYVKINDVIIDLELGYYIRFDTL